MQSICIIFGEGAIALSKLLKKIQSRMMVYVMACMLFAGLLSLGVGYCIIHYGLEYVEVTNDDPDANKVFQRRYIEDLQQYIEKNNIDINHITDLQEWIEKNPYVYLAIYQNNKVVFNSEYDYNSDEEDEEVAEEVIEDSVLLGEDKLYLVQLADGTMASADIFCYDYWKYNYYIWGVGVVLGIVVFILTLSRLLQHKLRYINEIEQDLQILEGGNLEHEVTVKGYDELAGLAHGINQMRLSILENMEKEQRMLQANKDLVTSMSHDLRTPLTILTGYLELLNMDYDADVEKRKHYLELSLGKSREIKELSDELFEYFLIYGENRKELVTEPVAAFSLVSDLVENQFLGLEEEGFSLVSEIGVEEDGRNCIMNVQYMQRVLNNILSNLLKYADKKVPIVVRGHYEKCYLRISVENGIRKNLELHESTKIGLITCRRIMRMHHGRFETKVTENTFTVILKIPMEE